MFRFHKAATTGRGFMGPERAGRTRPGPLPPGYSPPEGNAKSSANRAGVPRWRPHQLRHAVATRIRQEFGLEMAQLVLGHSSTEVTDAVYAERDMAKVIEVMRRIG